MAFPPQGSGSGGGGGGSFPTAIPKLSDLIIDTNKDWETKRIRNIGAPTASTDASTKKYVDDKFTGSNNEILKYNASGDSLVSSGVFADGSNVFVNYKNQGKYLLKFPGSISTPSFGGIVNADSVLLFPYACPIHPRIAFVANMFDSVVESEFGGGLIVYGTCGHTSAGDDYSRVSLGVKPKGGTAIIEPLQIYDDGIAHFNYKITGESVIDIKGTYNINGVPHTHDERYIKLSDGLSKLITEDLDMQGYKIVNLGTPEDALDAANKVYVDSYVLGLQWKAPVEGFATDNTLIEAENPYDGARFIVSENAVGEWATYINYIVQWDDSESDWIYIEPASMWTVTCYHCSEDGSVTNLTYSEDDGWVLMGITTYHGGLAGLSNDDHFQYVHISNARTISATHTFSGSKPFNVSGNTLVNNLNAEYLSGVPLATLQRVVTSSYNGLCPRLSGNESQFLNGHGQWVTVNTGGSGDGTWGSITGDITSQTDLITILNNKLSSNEIAYDSYRLGGVEAFLYPTFSDIPQAGDGLTELFHEEDSRVYLNVYTDDVTCFINALGQVQVIGSAGDPYVFATFPTIVANNAVGGIEPGYVLSNKHIKTVMMDMTGSNYVYYHDKPYVYGFMSFYHADMNQFSDVMANMFASYLYETESTKICNYGIDMFPTASGFITVMYPESYGALKSVELGTSTLSQDIASEFATYQVTYLDTPYIVYKHNKVTEIPISSYPIRFVQEI